MSRAEAALFSLLTTGSPNAVAAIVGTRVYPDILPQGVLYPAIRLQRISTPRSQYRTLNGRAEYASPRMQIDCWALSRLGALALSQAVYQLLEGFTGTIAGLRIDYVSTEDEGGDVEIGIGPDGRNVYRERLDVIVAHPE